MSVIRHDALTDPPGNRLSFDVAPRDVPDPTEDLSNEVTSELAAAQRPPKPAQGDEPDRAAGARDPAVRPAAAGEGSVLRDRYVLEQELGHGGTAMVYRAVDLRRDASAPGGRHVAVKLLRPELRDRPDCIARLQREFRLTQAVAHPNVVRFHDLDCDRGSWFIVMELLIGETLGPCLRRAAPLGLPKAEVMRISAAVGDALSFAHRHGVTHGDVKPDNVFITASGEVRLLDFGVAPEPPSMPPDGAPASPAGPAATRAYASPEVLEGRAPDPRDDTFSLACVMYEMLAGRHPYGRRGSDAARNSILMLEPIASMPPEQWATLASGLGWSRAARPDIRDLSRLRGRSSPLTVPQVARSLAVTPPDDPKRRGVVWLSAIAAAVALALGVLIGRLDVDSPAAPSVAPLPAGNIPVDARPTALETAAGDPAGAAPELPAAPLAQAAAQPPLAAFAQSAGAGAGLVSFDSSTMVVSNRALVAAIPLRHFNLSRQSVTVTWRAIDGTARAGRDYGGPQSGSEWFAEGHTFRILYVPILVDLRARGDRTFTVELTGASTGVDLGSLRRIDVTILDDA
jgi:serine/threonine protein kinase